jgi:hypothetical protein
MQAAPICASAQPAAGSSGHLAVWTLLDAMFVLHLVLRYRWNSTNMAFSKACRLTCRQLSIQCVLWWWGGGVLVAVSILVALIRPIDSVTAAAG